MHYILPFTASTQTMLTLQAVICIMNNYIIQYYHLQNARHQDSFNIYSVAWARQKKSWNKNKGRTCHFCFNIIYFFNTV